MANPFKEERECRATIDETLSKVMKGKISFLTYTHFVKACLIKYAVSRSMVEKFINDFFIETGDIVLDNNELKKAVQK